jgi:hypothetical protein
MDRSTIDQICKMMKLTTHSIGQDGVVDVRGSVSLNFKMLDKIYNAGFGQIGKLPIKFGRISRNFTVLRCHLSSMEGMPHTVLGNFEILGNTLTSLEGGPATVTGSYLCDENCLETLLGAPAELPFGYFSCRDNNLSDLTGAPKRLTSPKIGYSRIDFSNNPIETLKGLPKEFSYMVDNSTDYPLSGYVPLLFSKITGLPTYFNLTFDCVTELSEILFNGRIDGVMPRELIPTKINQLRDLEAKRIRD